MTQTARKKIDPKPAHARNNPELQLGEHEGYKQALARIQREKEEKAKEWRMKR